MTKTITSQQEAIAALNGEVEALRAGTLVDGLKEQVKSLEQQLVQQRKAKQEAEQQVKEHFGWRLAESRCP